MSMPSDTYRKPALFGSGDTGFDVNRIKADFPILRQKVNGQRLVYLDSAASSQKPQAVIDALDRYYSQINANIHRGLHTLSEKATAAYENTREHAARFIGGVKPEEIIFTNGATEAINLVASSWGGQNIGEGDEIVITEMEHHANLGTYLLDVLDVVGEFDPINDDRPLLMRLEAIDTPDIGRLTRA